MEKYIPADKLIAEIKGIIAAVQTKNHPDALGTMEQCLAAAEIEALNLVIDDIKELQQEQPDIIEHICLCAGIPAPFMDGNQWSILKGDNIQVGVVGFGDTKEEALINFITDIPIQQERPEVGLEKDIDAFFDKWDKNSKGCIFDENGARVTIETIKGVVKHFLNARKEEK